MEHLNSSVSRWPLWLLVLALVGLAVNCGPIEYINTVTRKASSEVSAAKAVDAQKWAPYHFTRAIEYLEKAREEASRADYQAANRFGRIAHDDARQARKLAIERAKTGQLPGPPKPPEDSNRAPTERDDDAADAEIDADQAEGGS